MSMIFLFPKIIMKINFDEIKKENFNEDIFKNHETDLYFPRDINKFIESFLKHCQSFKFTYEEMMIQKYSFSKSKFSNNSLNTLNSEDINKDEEEIGEQYTKTEQHNSNSLLIK